MLASAGRTTVRRFAVGFSKTSTTNLPYRRPVLKAQNVWNGSSIVRRLLATATSDLKSPALKPTSTTGKPTKERKKSKESSVKPRAAAKPKPAKKELTEEQKRKAKAKKEREKVRELIRLALERPKTLPRSAWLVVNAEFSAKGKEGVGEAAAKYRSLTKEEQAHYEHIASQNRAANEDTYKKWIESCTPEQINTANKARAALRRRIPGTRRFPKLKDDRRVTRPLSSYLLFARERSGSEEYSHMKATEIGQALGKQWRELPEHEKKKYKDAAAANISRYRETAGTAYKGDATVEAKVGAAL